MLKTRIAHCYLLMMLMPTSLVVFHKARACFLAPGDDLHERRLNDKTRRVYPLEKEHSVIWRAREDVSCLRSQSSSSSIHLRLNPNYLLQ